MTLTCVQRVLRIRGAQPADILIHWHVVILGFLLLTTAAVFCEAQATCTCGTAQNKALLEQFRDATGGASWTLPWSGTDMCLWQGVSCNGAHVAAIKLPKNGLSGTLPADVLSQFLGMENFDVSNNGMSGTLPPSLGQWTTILEIYFHNNSFTGTLPASYGAWSNVVHVRVDDNMLTGTLPMEWSGMVNLTDLIASHNRLSGTLPASYKSWAKMTMFIAPRNLLTGSIPPEYASWSSNFSYLDICENRLTGPLPEAFKTFSAMEEFIVFGNSLSGTLPMGYGLGWHKNFKRFSASENLFTGTLPREYGAWASLKTFEVPFNQLSGTLPPEYGNFSASIKTFNVGYNTLTGTLPDAYKAWVKLVDLSFHTNNLTGPIPESYGPSFPLLNSFVLSSNQFNGTIPVSLSKLTNVTSFRLNLNKLTGTLPTELSMCTAMEVFVVAMNLLTGTLPPEYSAWRGLKSFFASNNDFYGTLPEAYSSWWRMIEFTVSSNRMSGTLPASYSAWRYVNVVSFSSNRFTGTLPASYGPAWFYLVRLSLFENGLSGTFPSSYSQWSNIEQVSVASNHLSGTLPPEVGEGWKAHIDLFTTSFNNFSGTIPASFAAWTGISSIFSVKGNQHEGTLPLFMSTWTKLVSLSLSQNRFTGSIPPQWSQLASLRSLYLHCNDLDGALPPSFATMRSLRELSVSGNPKLSGTLPEVWGGSTSVLSLQRLLMQNTSLSGPFPSTWGSSLFAFGCLLTYCGSRLCGPAPTSLLATFLITGCINDVASCSLDNQTFITANSVQERLSDLPPCSTLAPPSPSPPPTTATNGSETQLPPPMKKTRPAEQQAILVVSGPVSAVAALGASASAGLNIVRAGGAIRLAACEGGDTEEIVTLAGGHLGAVCGLCVLCVAAVAWRVRADATSSRNARKATRERWLGAAEALRVPGRLWGAVCGLVPALLEFGLGLILQSRGSSDMVLGVVSVAFSVAALACLWSSLTWRFASIWRKPASSTITCDIRRKNFFERVTSMYDLKHNGRWVDAVDSALPSYTACYGSIFEEYAGPRVWYIVWESGLAAVVSVLSAVAGATTNACAGLQVAGGTLQMISLVALLWARPLREARTLSLGVCMELLGFIGGLCLSVSALTADEDGAWSSAAANVLQAQFYVGAVLAVADGLYTRKIQEGIYSALALCRRTSSDIHLSAPHRNDHEMSRSSSRHTRLSQRKRHHDAVGIQGPPPPHVSADQHPKVDAISAKAIGRLHLKRLIEAICESRQGRRSNDRQSRR